MVRVLLHRPLPEGTQAQQARHRRVTRILRCAVICVVVTAAPGVAATLVHADSIAAVCLRVLPLSYAVVLALQLLLPPRRRRSIPPRVSPTAGPFRPGEESDPAERAPSLRNS